MEQENVSDKINLSGNTFHRSLYGSMAAGKEKVYWERKGTGRVETGLCHASQTNVSDYRSTITTEMFAPSTSHCFYCFHVYLERKQIICFPKMWNLPQLFLYILWNFVSYAKNPNIWRSDVGPFDHPSYSSKTAKFSKWVE